MKITTIGLDLAKSVFQIHAVDEQGVSVLVKRLRRKQMLPFFTKLSSCLIGIEACGSAHHWARTLVALGHEVKLMPPAYVNRRHHLIRSPAHCSTGSHIMSTSWK